MCRICQLAKKNSGILILQYQIIWNYFNDFQNLKKKCVIISNSLSYHLNVVCEDEGLSSTECDCRGYLSKVHHSCLKEWVRYKGSTRCEICTSHFACVTPPLQPGLLQLEVCIYDVSYSVPYNVLKLLLLMISIYIPGAKQIDHIHIMRGSRGEGFGKLNPPSNTLPCR